MSLASLLKYASFHLGEHDGADESAISLKPGDGQNVTAANCAACHSLDYIQMNSPFLSPDGWKAEVTKMRQAYGAPIDPAVADTIVRYLSASYAAPPKP